ncbi:MAG: TAXI family TRAP transporter solute-binding subunit [Chloroflexi bacterium]|nr:TAXI family TRAP transporter solute-binding subunit [Chloroflexota bacterium]
MRQALACVVPLVLALVVACGPSVAPSAAPPAQPAAPQAAQPAAPPAPPAAAPAQPAVKPAPPAAQPAKPQVAKSPAEAAKPAASGGKQRMLFGAAANGSSYYIYAVGLGKLWNSKVPEVEVTVVETGGGNDNLKRMDKGEFPSSLVVPDLTYRAWHGIDEFKDKPITTQRVIYMFAAAPTIWMVRKETSITKIDDLTGKDFTPGIKGSANEKQTLNIFAALDIKPRYYSAGVQDMLQAAKDKRIVGFGRTQAGPRTIDAATQEINVTTPMRVLGVTPEQEKTVVAKFPYYRFMTVEKDALAPGFPDSPVRSVVLNVGVGVHKDMADQLAYKLTKAAIEDNTPQGEAVQATSFPAVNGLDFVQMTLDYTLTPLHAGAAKYFKELGKQLKPEQAPAAN